MPMRARVCYGVALCGRGATCPCCRSSSRGTLVPVCTTRPPPAVTSSPRPSSGDDTALCSRAPSACAIPIPVSTAPRRLPASASEPPRPPAQVATHDGAAGAGHGIQSARATTLERSELGWAGRCRCGTVQSNPKKRTRLPNECLCIILLIARTSCLRLLASVRAPLVRARPPIIACRPRRWRLRRAPRSPAAGTAQPIGG